MTSKICWQTRKSLRSVLAICGVLLLLSFAGCKSNTTDDHASAASKPVAAPAPIAVPQVPEDALPAERTGGFDGMLAYNHVAKLVAFGPRPSGSQAISQAQDYITSQLSSFGCTVDSDAFSSDTPAGRLAMKNIVVKIPGERQGIILLGTHYDTKKLDNFVGADDGGSSTGLMLEMARRMCEMRPRYSIWIAFFDGEEAVRQQWQDPDNRYGSRQLAAKMAASGDLKRVHAMILADLVGGKNLQLEREQYSTVELVDLIWNTAKRLGYGSIFVNHAMPVDDDHLSFLQRNVPSADIIDLVNSAGYWHTPQDTMEKVSARSLGIVGHVILESVRELQTK